MDKFILGLLIFAGLVIAWRWFNRGASDNLGIKGKLVWVDHGKNTKPFFNSDYRVLGKPDLMYRVNDGILAVEYKGRKSNIYNSDIAQGLTASLAARGDGYKVTQLLVKTDNTEKYINLPKSDKGLYELIAKHVETVRQAKFGKVLPANPSFYKCLHCAYSQSCQRK